ncbi:MAG: TRAP transporter small permease [Candidatus Bathyarchaeia archaeon]
MIFGMVVLIFSQVVFRYLFNRPLAWTEELSRHFMIWAAFLGAAVAYRKKAHIGVEFLVAKLRKPWQQWVERFVHLSCIGFASFITIYGSFVVKKTMSQLSSALGIPMGFIYASIPVGATLLVIFAVEKLLHLPTPQEDPSKSHHEGKVSYLERSNRTD